VSEVQIRSYRDEDRHAVLDLRARVFEGLEPDREKLRWAWQFETNPFVRNDTPRTWVAEHEGKIIGNYGMLPLEFSADGERVTGLCGMDFCVDSVHRNLGLGMRLTKAFIDTPGCAVHTVTSPTPAAAKLMAYYGSEILDGEAEPCLWVHAGAEPTGVPLEEQLNLETLERFDERSDRFFDKVARDFRLLIARDQRYLNWRYCDYPFGQARITAALRHTTNLAGFSVVQADPSIRRAHLCELFAHREDETTLETLVRDAVEFVRGSEIDELYVFHRDPLVQALLERNGFQVVRGHGMSAVCRTPSGMGVKDWYLSAGDGDILFGVGGAGMQAGSAPHA
jgi:GNAT superfamily N-acetyltransferase